MKEKRISEEELEKIRSIPLLDVLDQLGFEWEEDPDFRARKDKRTKRLKVYRNTDYWELIITGMKWMDPLSKKTGGGAIDLVMYLYGINFLKAVKKLL